MANLIESTRQLRELLLRDRFRPAYHLTTPEGVCCPFDPNGALFWQGRYHLFYIVQTEKGHCWAHVSSHDLVRWRQHPLALEPGGADNCIFSGGAFVDRHGVPTISYWGVDYGNQKPVGVCLATSTDPELEQWTKSPHNPVIRETEIGLTENADGTVWGAADPSAIWSHDGRYYLLTGNLLVLRKLGIGKGLVEHQGDTAYLFVSDDLVHWQYRHPFYQSDRKWTRADEDCMCPDFFPLGDRHVLLFISHNLGCQYYLGRYEHDHFYPEQHGRMTWVDNAFFAPESLVDDRGRRIMWAWLFDGREPATRQASMWSGTMSLPRVLWLGDDGTLRMAPPEELALLRYAPWQSGPLTVGTNTTLPLTAVQGDSLELSIELTSATATQFGVKVRCSPNGEEQTAVFYDAVEEKLKVDTRAASLGEGPKVVEGGPLVLGAGEPLKLRVFVDRSIVEVFANDRQAVARCVYPTRRDSLGVSLSSQGGAAQVTSVQAWKLAPANPW